MKGHTKPTLLIISATIRRDLHRPFRRFTKFRVIHAYHAAAYGDLGGDDLGPDTHQYRSIGELRRLINELKPDLIQGPEPVASRLMLQVAWVVWRSHRRTGTPYFFPMFENLPLSHKFGPVGGWIMSQILRRYAYDAGWVYVLNEGARQTLQRLGFTDGVMLDRKVAQMATAPDQASSDPWILDVGSDQGRSGSRMTNRQKIVRANWGNWGIDRTEFRPAKDPAKEREDHPVVLFVGRLSHAKGVDTLLESFVTVRSALPSAELWLVGPTKLDTGNEGLIARAKAMEDVKLLGSKKQRELPALFRQAWVTVLLSRTTKHWAEQVGMVNLQSLACGTPVVTTDSGSIAEYLGGQNSGDRIQNPGLSRIPNSEFRILETKRGAILVPENDPEAAAQAILQILQDTKRREQMGKAGVAWVRDSFDEAVCVPQLELETLERFQRIQNVEFRIQE